MAVKLRKRANADGTTTPWLDITHNGIRKAEFLSNLKLITKPTNTIERDSNRNNLAIANRILLNRSQELEANDYDVDTIYKQNVDFNSFFESFKDKYKKKDKRVIEACLTSFKDFQEDKEIKQLSARALSPSIVHDFKTYLTERYNGETPSNYFKKFKMVVLAAVRQNIITKNPCQDISIKIKQGISKDVLTFDEIKLMAQSPVKNQDVKRAFLFSCYTGLRYSDVVQLKWSNIDLINKALNFKQAKTGESVNLNLHDSVLNMLGEGKKANSHVFTLPSHTACTKTLKAWAKRSGINKHITWHVARHSFATNIIFHGSDVNTASKLLGHNSIRYTERYTHIVTALKEKAISNLPSVEIS